MSGGFSFPPPPPPPPKPSNSPSQHGTTNQQHPGAQSHRGNRGGRAGPRGRGQVSGRGHGFRQAPQRGGFSADRQNENSQAPQSKSTTNHGGVYTTPYQTQQSQNTTNVSSHGPHGNDSLSRTVAGHKRKLDALKLPNEKPKKPGPPTAPAVPSFGAPVVSQKPPPTSGTHKNATAVSGRRSLGLTPATHGAAESDSDSEPDVLDEEAMYAELGDKLTFEHNGVVMSLKSQADLVAWKKERQKKWPTKARMVERDDERRRIGEERRRLLRIASPAQPSVQARKAESKQLASSDNLETPAANQDERARRLSELRKKVLESEAKNRQAKVRDGQSNINAVPVDVALCGQDDRAIEVVAAPASIENEGLPEEENEAAAQSSDEDPDDPSSGSSSDSSSDSDSDDDAPEEVTSKPSETQSDLDARPVCRVFASRGNCKYGDSCHFKHEGSVNDDLPLLRRQRDQRTPRKAVQTVVQSTGGRKGIFQRLKEQEQEAEDRMALQIIKYLGKAGFFDGE